MGNLDERNYKNYITAAKSKVKEIERGMKDLAKWKRISFLSYEEWVKYQKGDLKT